MDQAIEIEQLDLVLFDGVCNLCEGAVQFIIRHDIQNKYTFAPLQHERVQMYLKAHQLDSTRLNTIIYLKQGQPLIKSTAALEISKGLSQPYAMASYLLYVPKVIRDAVYDLISKSRYTVFGKKTSCMIPSPELKAKFPFEEKAG